MIGRIKLRTTLSNENLSLPQNGSMRAARAHRTLPPPDGDGGIVTLDQVRPHPRTQNEYVEGPKFPQREVSQQPSHGVPVINRVALPVRQQSGLRNLNDTLITRQPVSISPPLKKEPILEVDNDIICANCGKCKCGSCTEPKKLPQRWCCGDYCQVSPDCIVDTCTCFCCVKAVFYHCGKDQDDDEDMCYMHPCAGCTKPHCVKRWTCMAMMACCLPCLCCYWPARAVLKACTSCYNKCRKKGCQCTTRQTKKQTVDEKNGSPLTRGLLIESDSSSA